MVQPISMAKVITVRFIGATSPYSQFAGSNAAIKISDFSQVDGQGRVEGAVVGRSRRRAHLFLDLH